MEVARLVERGRAVGAGERRHAAADRVGARGRLVAEQRERARRRPHEGQARVGAGLREVGALGQEAVAGVHRVAAARVRGGHQRRRVEIGGRAVAVERVRGVGLARMQR